MGAPAGSGLGLLTDYHYLKFPPERLVSGILTVVVQNSDYKSGEEYHIDQMQRVQTNWASTVPDNAKKTFPLGRNTPEDGSIEGNEPARGDLAPYITGDAHGTTDGKHYDRTTINQSGGDYDVFMFALTANFHCEDKVLPHPNKVLSFNDSLWETGTFPGGSVSYWTPECGRGSYLTTADLEALGCPDTTSGTWAFDFDHFGCQSFVRSTLIARHNNAYQHDFHTADSRYYNYRNSSVPRKEWHINKQTLTSDWFISQDNDGTFDNPTGPGRPKVDERIFQNGVYSTKRWDPKGIIEPEEAWSDGDSINWNLTDVKGTGNVGIDLSESATDENDNEALNNTYFNPVYDIQIYGQHPLTVTTNRTGLSSPNTASNLKLTNFSPVRVSDHPQDWWQLVVEVNKWGFDSDGTAIAGEDVDADTSYVKTRTNIFYQPFGETQQLKFSSNIHT